MENCAWSLITPIQHKIIVVIENYTPRRTKKMYPLHLLMVIPAFLMFIAICYLVVNQVNTFLQRIESDMEFMADTLNGRINKRWFYASLGRSDITIKGSYKGYDITVSISIHSTVADISLHSKSLVKPPLFSIATPTLGNGIGHYRNMLTTSLRDVHLHSKNIDRNNFLRKPNLLVDTADANQQR